VENSVDKWNRLDNQLMNLPGWFGMDIKKQVVETTCESHEKNSITATIL